MNGTLFTNHRGNDFLLVVNRHSAKCAGCGTRINGGQGASLELVGFSPRYFCGQCIQVQEQVRPLIEECNQLLSVFCWRSFVSAGFKGWLYKNPDKAILAATILRDRLKELPEGTRGSWIYTKEREAVALSGIAPEIAPWLQLEAVCQSK